MAPTDGKEAAAADERVRETLRAFIARHLFAGTFDDDESFTKRGIIDSVGIVELVQFVEEEFGIEVELRDVTAENFDSLCRVAAFILQRRKRGIDPDSAAVG